MNVSSIGSGNPPLPSPLELAVQQSRRDFLSLANALQSGDLGSAQKAFTSLQQDIQKIQGTASTQGGGQSQSGQRNPLATDLAALGKALDGNDLATAQKAFATLAQDLRGLRQGHHRHHHPAPDAAAAAATSSTSDADSDAPRSASATGTILNAQA